jgi:hypothetical protein
MSDRPTFEKEDVYFVISPSAGIVLVREEDSLVNELSHATEEAPLHPIKATGYLGLSRFSGYGDRFFIIKGKVVTPNQIEGVNWNEEPEKYFFPSKGATE